MDYYTRNTIVELNLCTASSECHALGDGRFEFCVDAIAWPTEKATEIGLKRLCLPKMEKKIEFRYAVCGVSTNFSADIVNSRVVTYRSLEEFAFVFETLLMTDSSQMQDVCMNFDSSHERHLCVMNGHKHSSSLTLTYSFGRFRLLKSFGLCVYLCENVLRLLGFDIMENLKENSAGLYQLRDMTYISGHKVEFLGDGEREVRIVVYDAIDSYSLLKGGERQSVLFSGDIERHDYSSNGLLCIKKLLQKNFRTIVFGFFTENMTIFRPDLDLKKYPISFVLTIM